MHAVIVTRSTTRSNVFFFNDTATTEIYTLSLHDALPIFTNVSSTKADGTYPSGTSIPITVTFSEAVTVTGSPTLARSEGHTAAHQSHLTPVSRLLLEKTNDDRNLPTLATPPPPSYTLPPH